MSTALVASWRVNLPYTVQGKLHRVRQYVRIATTTPTFTLRHRDGATTLLWSTMATQLASRLSNILPTGAAWGTANLENLVGTLWQLNDTAAIAATPAGTWDTCSELTAVLRDTTFKKIRLTMLDTNLTPPQHYAALGAVADIDNALGGFITGASNVNDPFYYVVGRSNNYLHASPISGITVTLNAKLRRARGMV